MQGRAQQPGNLAKYQLDQGRAYSSTSHIVLGLKSVTEFESRDHSVDSINRSYKPLKVSLNSSASFWAGFARIGPAADLGNEA